MSHESLLKNPEKNVQTINYLRQETVSSGEFNNDIVTIDLARVESLALADNSKNGIESSLIAAIKAGQELFGVLAVRVDGKKVSFALSRIQEQARGQLVGVMSDVKPHITSVGRNSYLDASNPLDEETSRDHFSVELTPEGTITVRDNGSTNGTEVFASFKGFDMRTDAPSPFESGSWVPPSKELKQFCL